MGHVANRVGWSNFGFCIALSWYDYIIVFFFLLLCSLFNSFMSSYISLLYSSCLWSSYIYMHMWLLLLLLFYYCSQCDEPKIKSMREKYTRARPSGPGCVIHMCVQIYIYIFCHFFCFWSNASKKITVDWSQKNWKKMSV